MAVIMLVLVLCSCGRAAAAPSPAGRPATVRSHVAPFPLADTSLATAPRALAALWRGYDVTEIPGRAVLAAVPAVPLVNASAGAVSDSKAQALDDGVVRAGALYGWANEHVQPALVARLYAEPFVVGALGVALAKGSSVHVPACDAYPTKVTFYAQSSVVKAEIRASDQIVQPGDVPVREDFAGPCTVTATALDGSVTVLSVTLTESVVAEGSLRLDPVLGPVFFTDAVINCQGDPAAAAGMCGQR